VPLLVDLTLQRGQRDLSGGVRLVRLTDVPRLVVSGSAPEYTTARKLPDGSVQLVRGRGDYAEACHNAIAAHPA
jgi:hypothetical protein